MNTISGMDQKFARYVFRLLPAQRVTLMAVLALCTGPAAGQEFGGSPPWGPETPTHFTGEIHQGESFEQAIGDGLYFFIETHDGYWSDGVSRSGGGDDYSRCVTPPFRGPNARDIMAWHFQRGDAGPGGVGQKREIVFVLNDEDARVQCADLELALQGKDTFENRISGRCWFQPLSVKLSEDPPEKQTIEEMKFEGECALHGALELWRLPVSYRIADGVTGWVTVCFGSKGQPGLRKDGDRYHLLISKQGTVHTSSILRMDRRGAKFERKNNATIPIDGPQQRIWRWMNGYATCGPFQSFFVGTADQYRNHSENPMLK